MRHIGKTKHGVVKLRNSFTPPKSIFSLTPSSHSMIIKLLFLKTWDICYYKFWIFIPGCQNFKKKRIVNIFGILLFGFCVHNCLLMQWSGAVLSYTSRINWIFAFWANLRLLKLYFPLAFFLLHVFVLEYVGSTGWLL